MVSKHKKNNQQIKRLKLYVNVKQYTVTAIKRIHNLIICKRKQKKVIALKGISQTQKENAEGTTNGIQEVDFICVESGVSVTMSWQD